MQFTTLVTSALLAASAIAAPGGGWGPWGGGPPKNCVSPSGIKALVDGYTYLLVNPGGPNFNATANKILTPDFQVFSDSILYLSGRPVCHAEPRDPSGPKLIVIFRSTVVQLIPAARLSSPHSSRLPRFRL